MPNVRQAAIKTASGQACLLAFDRADAAALKWARTKAAQMVTEIGATTRTAIREIVARAVAEGIPPRQASRLIRDVVGLHSNQAAAVANLRQELLDAGARATQRGRAVSVTYGQQTERVVGAPAGPGRVRIRRSTVRVPPGGLPPDRVSALIQRYAERLRRQRALSIARSESIAASTRGQQEMWRQNVSSGLLRGTEKQKWLTSRDERACQICMALNGQEVPLGGVFQSPFVGEISGPPAHTNCRCAVGLAVERG